ncbi:hypothetical protein [Pandoraea pulmonicola]|uniref:Uncharacterized protein n=1 Tax=Pandoraea pulmonicola TaxID=93221 RepID=A0AAJ4ZCN7_PANPU|nr:hypothetical protein [Pandoraea pulmonicola]SUA90948.1 Uncharacterised protein [Pandoraea pulmonicola]
MTKGDGDATNARRRRCMARREDVVGVAVVERCAERFPDLYRGARQTRQ